MHLPSRHATFRLQFIQRFLTGPLDLVWRKMAEAILHTVDGLGLDAGLFLMDVKQLRLAGLPQFYCGLFKVWRRYNPCTGYWRSPSSKEHGWILLVGVFQD